LIDGLLGNEDIPTIGLKRSLRVAEKTTAAVDDFDDAGN
jgi:hypothetical protein